MDRMPIDAARVVWVGYDDDTRRLECGHRDWTVHEFLDVPPHVHAGIWTSPSPGRYFEAYVEKAGYVSRRVD